MSGILDRSLVVTAAPSLLGQPNQSMPGYQVMLTGPTSPVNLETEH